MRFQLVCAIVAMTVVGSTARAENPVVDSASGNRLVNLNSEIEVLLATDREWAETARGENIDSICGFWTEDAGLYSVFGSGTRVEGKDQIRALVTKSRSQPGRSLTWEPVEAFVDVSGEVGGTRGTFEITSPGEDGKPVTRTGEYFNVWQKSEDNAWKCAIETHF
jgi:ketosteroid isomerase-like protein